MTLRIKELRQAKKLTQDQLAEMAGVSRSYLAEMENGTKTINDRRVAQVAKALGVNPRDLYPADSLSDRLRALPQEDRDQVEALVNHLYQKTQGR